MLNPKFRPKAAIVALLGSALVLTVTACSSGIPEADHKAVQDQLAKEQQKSAALQQQITQLQQQAGSGASIPGGSAVLGVKPVQPPAPRATPTPPPPGFTPPPPPKPLPQFFEPVAVAIYADTVTSGPGESRFNIDPAGPSGVAASCVQTSVFKRGQHVVWRFEAIDTSTGKRLTTDDVASAKVAIPNAPELTARFGRHGALDTSPWFWTAAWDVPLDYPTGVLDWTLTVTTKSGKTGTFKLISVSIPDRGIESRTQIIA